MHQASHPYVLQEFMALREGELARSAARHHLAARDESARRRRLWIIPARESRVRTVLSETVQLRGA